LTKNYLAAACFRVLWLSHRQKYHERALETNHHDRNPQVKLNYTVDAVNFKCCITLNF